MKRVIVHIDKLVLNGVARKDRHAFAQGLRNELSRVLAEPGSGERLAQRGDSAGLRVAGIRYGTRVKPARLGAQAGRAVAKGIKS